VAFTCEVCGQAHAGDVRDIRMELPEPIFHLDEEERDVRARVGDDSAVLTQPQGDRFFVRGLLELPIEGEDGYFGYGSWIEVSREDFDTLSELWDDDEGWRSGPFDGTLANELAPYFATVGLPVQIRLRDVQLLPLVELAETNHELVRAQRRGISRHRAHELAATVAA
jgi:hypothetical protein